MIYGYETLESHRHRILCFLPLFPLLRYTGAAKFAARRRTPKPLAYVPYVCPASALLTAPDLVSFRRAATVMTC